MELKLFICKSGENVINKKLVLIHTVDIRLKENTNLISPTLILSNMVGVDLLKCNYCYLDQFERYYFIRDISVNKGLYNVNLECDVLESFKGDILSSSGKVSRQLLAGDLMNLNSDTYVNKNYITYPSDVTIDLEKNIVLSSIGGFK